MSAADRLTAAVERATPRLRDLSDAAAGRPSAPGKWSPKDDYVDHLEHHLGQIFGGDTMSA